MYLYTTVTLAGGKNIPEQQPTTTIIADYMKKNAKIMLLLGQKMKV